MLYILGIANTKNYALRALTCFHDCYNIFLCAIKNKYNRSKVNDEVLFNAKRG